MKYTVHGDLKGNKLSFSDIEAPCAEYAIAVVKSYLPEIISVTPVADETSDFAGTSNQKMQQQNGLKKLIEDLGMQVPGFEIFIDASAFFKPPVAEKSQTNDLQQVSLQKLKRLHGWALVLIKALSLEDPLYNDIYKLSNHVEAVIKRLSEVPNKEAAV